MANEESIAGPEVLLAVRRRPGAPALGAQVEDGLRAAIRAGRLAPGARLPPTRTLARDLGVSRRTVVAAFEQLASEGWLQARVGSGTFVRDVLPAAAPTAPAPARATDRGTRPRLDFFPGHPDLSAFPRAAFARALRDALRELPDAALGYGDPRGLRELRDAVAALVARSRGVVCRPRDIVITQGAVQALGLLATQRRIAIEDPYLAEHRAVLVHHEADVVPVEVDALGVRDEAVVAARPELALLTPAHQCPTGVALSAPRRAALARWAQETGALLVEDDYDAEFRYDRAPVAALQGLAPAHVAYLGSASKALAPGLRLGWVVAPPDRLEALVTAKRYADTGSPVLEQAALARFIASGGYDRHVRALRRRHRERRDALVAAVATHLPDARVEGLAAGLHAVVRLSAPVGCDALVAAARARDVGCSPLSAWYADPPAETTGIVLGYGQLAPAAIGEGVRRLADAIAALG